MEDLSGKVKYDAILLLNHKNPNSHDSWDIDDAQVVADVYQKVSSKTLLLVF